MTGVRADTRASTCEVTLYTATVGVVVEILAFAIDPFGSACLALALVLLVGGLVLTAFSDPVRAFGKGLAIAGVLPVVGMVLCFCLVYSVYVFAA